jgi:hypothetical protein
MGLNLTAQELTEMLQQPPVAEVCFREFTSRSRHGFRKPYSRQKYKLQSGYTQVAIE